MNIRAVGIAVILGGAAFCAAAVMQSPLPQSTPEEVGLLSSQLRYIGGEVAASIQRKELCGAVVLVARHGRVAYWKAFGNRSVEPDVEGMTVDTIFDVASLTKVVATTPSIMLLVERGRLRLDDKVKRYLPAFTGGGKDAITVRQLLTHYSGLPPDFDLSKPWEGYSGAMEELWKLATQSDPGKDFAYSDLNFIALAELVHVLSGQTLDVFARDNVFAPLGMSETRFRPPAAWRPRIAPTESRANTLQYLRGRAGAALSDEILRGEVHDPTAWRMGGVTGHAGLFSSASDLFLYAQMLLNRGTYNGRRILSPIAVSAMTRGQSPKSAHSIRGLGWDIDSAYSAPRGDLFAGGYGHTGFTGTSVWIDPPTETVIILLSNRVHPDGKGDVTHLRGVVADIVAAAISD